MYTSTAAATLALAALVAAGGEPDFASAGMGSYIQSQPISTSIAAYATELPTLSSYLSATLAYTSVANATSSLSHSSTFATITSVPVSSGTAAGTGHVHTSGSAHNATTKHGTSTVQLSTSGSPTQFSGVTESGTAAASASPTGAAGAVTVGGLGLGLVGAVLGWMVL